MKKSCAKILLLLLCVCLLQTSCNRAEGGQSALSSVSDEDPYSALESQSSVSGSQSGESSGLASENSSKKTSDSSATSESKIWKKYSPEITVRMARYTDDVIEATLSQLDGETIGDNRWLTLYKEKLGINIKYDWVAKGNNGYDTKLTLSIASRQLPDIFSVTPLQMNQLAAAGLLEDLTNIYRDYASSFTKETLHAAGDDIFKAATIGGKLMGLPCSVDPSCDSPMLWIRKDWLDNLGLKMPKNMDELCTVIKKFKENDPDKNGKNDTYGFSSYKGLWGTIAGLEGFFAGYHSYPRIWQEDKSGNLAYGAIQPEAKAALSKLRELYSNGYMPIDFGVYDAGAVTEMLTSGKIGIQYGAHWCSVYPLNLSKEKDSKADWVAIPLLSSDSKPAKTTFIMAAANWYVVKKGYKNPEALVKLFNMFLETNWGKTQQWNKYFLDGKIEGVWKLSPIFPSVTNVNVSDYKELEEARKTNDYSKLGGSAKGIQARLAANDWAWTAVYSSGGSMSVLQKYAEENIFVKDKFITAPTPTMVSKLNTLAQMQNETYIKIIMGNAPLSDFEKFVANWKKVGGDKITKEVNDWYKGR